MLKPRFDELVFGQVHRAAEGGSGCAKGMVMMGRSASSSVFRLAGRMAFPRWASSTAIVLAMLAGCGSFVPPPAPELTTIPDSTAVPTITVEMILAGEDVDDRVSWVQAARLEAANAKAILSVAQLPKGDPPSKVADLIRKAVARGVSGLIVEPVGGTEFVEAVNDARDQGVAVIVIDTKVPARTPSKTYPAVVYVPFDEPARLLVEGVIKRAEVDGLAADGTAVVLVNAKAGLDTEVRVDTIKKSLEKAGVAKVERVDFEGDYQAASKALTAKLEADPKITIVISHEEQGMSGGVATRLALGKKRKFELAGTVSIDRVNNPDILSGCSGMVNRNIPNMARQSLKAVVAMVKKETVPEETLVPLPYHALGASDKVAEDREAAAKNAPPSPEMDREKPPKKP